MSDSRIGLAHLIYDNYDHIGLYKSREPTTVVESVVDRTMSLADTSSLLFSSLSLQHTFKCLNGDSREDKKVT